MLPVPATPSDTLCFPPTGEVLRVPPHLRNCPEGVPVRQKPLQTTAMIVSFTPCLENQKIHSKSNEHSE